jgi:hypothetical protein
MALTLDFTPSSGPANEVMATPNGSPGSVSIRALVAADFPGDVAYTDVSNIFSVDQEFDGTLTTFGTTLASIPGGNLGLITRRDTVGVSTALGLWNADSTNTNGSALSFRATSTNSGATAYKQYASLEGICNIHDDATMTGALLTRIRTNNVLAAEWTVGGGLLAGAASGGAQGIGTINATNYYVNGSQIAAANISDYNGAGTWIPIATNLVTTGTVTLAGTYVKIGKMIIATVKITTAGASTSASTANSTSITLPFTAANDCAGTSVDNNQNIAMTGGVLVHSTSVYPPTFSQPASTIVYITAAYQTT